MVNAGTIAASVSGEFLALDVSTLSNSGLIIAENGGILETGYGEGNLNGGRIEIFANSGLEVYETAYVDAAMTLAGGFVAGYYGYDLTLAAGGTLAGYGTIDGNAFDQATIFDAGTIVASGGELTIGADVTGGGTLSVAGTGTLALGSYASNDVDLLASGAVLALAGSLFSGTIAGFGAGDELVINGLAATIAGYGGGVLTLGNAAGTLALQLAGSFSVADFTATSPSLDETVVQFVAPANRVTLAAPGTLFDNPGIVTAVSGISVTDPADTTITVQVSDAYGKLSASPASGALAQGNGTDSLVLSGTVSAVNAELASLKYQAPGVGQASDTIAVYASAASGAQSALINVTVNQPPTFALPASELLQYGVAGALSGVSLGKPGAEAGEEFSVTLSDSSVIITGTAAEGGGISGSGSKSVTLTGTLAAINAELAGIKLTGTADDELTLTANDGLGGVQTAYLALDVNVPPVIDAPATFSARDGAAVTIAGLGITDPYAQGAGETLHVTLAAASGLLASGAAGVTGNDTHAITISGTLASVNAALAALTYTGGQAGPSDDKLTITAADSLGGVVSGTITAAIADGVVSFNLPGSELLQAGTAGALAGVTLAKADALGTEDYTVVLLDTGATITDSAVGSGSVVGSGGTIVTLMGVLGTINAELAAARLTGSLDSTLTLSASDGLGGGDIVTLPIDVNIPAAITAPQSFVAIDAGTVGGLGISIADPYAASAGETLTIVLTDEFGTLAAAGGGAVVTGDNSHGLTISGTLAAVDAALANLTYRGAAGGWTTDPITLTARDTLGGVSTATITADAPAPPGISFTGNGVVGISLTGTGIESPIDGLSVTAGANQSGGAITLSLSDTLQGGTLAVLLQSGVSVRGNYSDDLTLIGDAGALDTALSSLIYTANPVSLSGAGDVEIAALDIAAVEGGASASTIVALTAAETGDAHEPVAQPAGLGIGPGTLVMDGYVGTFYAEYPLGTLQATAGNGNTYNPGASGTNPPVMDASGKQEEYAPVVGDWTVEGTSASNIAVDQATLVLTATDATSAADDTVTFIIQSNAVGNPDEVLPDQRITVVYNPAYLPGGGRNGPNGPGGSGNGDVHLTTFDGLKYDFQAAGEFVLAKSTVPGDSFQVQIRLQPWYSSATVSVMTEIAAGVGNDRVTFDLNRADVVWVNGAAVTLTGSTPYNLGGAGTLVQTSSNSWVVTWNTGESITVNDFGNYFDVNTSLPANAAPDSVKGLLGNYNGNTANDLALPDGTVLQQPLSSAELYTTFANAWRVTQATSLLDYGTGQTTETFTDLSFPSDNVTLSSLPASLYENALDLVIAAGITNPAAQQDAVEDYLLTGDTSFITADGQDANASQVMANPTSASTPEIGIGPDAPSVLQSSSGTTAVGFTVYATETSASAQIVDYGVVASGAGYLSASNFVGGVLPAGTVTIAAGQSSAALTLDVTGALSLASEILEVTIASPDSEAVLDPTAFVTIGNVTPVEGVDGAPAFELPEGGGTLSGSGEHATLNLGTLALGSGVEGFALDIVNAGSAGADTLSGVLSASGSSLISFFGGLGPVAGLGAGALDGLIVDVDTGTAGAASETLTFAASETNPSAYDALLGNYTLTIDADVVPAPILLAPVQDLVQARTLGALAGVSVTVAAGYDDEFFSVTLADSAGTLGIGTLGGATLSGGGTHLTLSGSLTDINTALQSLDFTGTQNDVVTLTADFSGGGTGETSFQVSANQPPAFSGSGTLHAFFGEPVTLTGVTLSDPDGISANETLTVTLSDNTGTLTGTAQDGGTVSGSGTHITLTGGLIAVEAELGGISYTAAAGLSSDTLSLSAADGRGGSATDTVDVLAEAACFAAGTRILTAQGALVRVEDLREGDLVETCSGEAARIIWMGRRTMAPRRHPRPEAVQPILISAGALGHGLPWRDLVVSPDHALFLEGHLIPAKALTNGFTIRQLDRDIVAYYHIELPEHAVLLAEGVAAESYLETGNRRAFENGGDALTLHPDLAQSRREAEGCAPFAEFGPAVEAARSRILDLAWIATTGDPGLHIRYENGSAIISSHAAIPGEIFADPRDRRLLGVKVAALRVGRRDVPVDHPKLTEGWHGMEPDGRWTNGCAVIPKSIMGRAKTIQVTLAATLRYPIGTSKGNIRLPNAVPASFGPAKLPSVSAWHDFAKS